MAIGKSQQDVIDVSDSVRFVAGTVLAIASNDSTIRMYEIGSGQVRTV